MKIEIVRQYLPTETVGDYLVDGVSIVKTLELPKGDGSNTPNKTCIPEGSYLVKKEFIAIQHQQAMVNAWVNNDPVKFQQAIDNNHFHYPHFRFYNVPGRIGILIHKITYVKDLLGCIGVGMSFADFNKDGVPDIAQSTVGLQKLFALMPDEFYVIVREAK